jgi:hypothetical protein
MTNEDYYLEFLNSRYLISEMAEKYNLTWNQMADILTAGRDEHLLKTESA